MAFHIRTVDYFYTTSSDRPGEAYKLLSTLASLGVNLLAFTGVPVGKERTQLTVFPEDSHQLLSAAREAGMSLDGPQRAFLAQGDDELGALAQVHEKLFHENINVYASSGVADGKGSYGYILYVRPEEFDRATKALGL